MEINVFTYNHLIYSLLAISMQFYFVRGEQDTIIKSKFFEKIFDEELKYVMRERLSKRQCKMSVCIYKLSCPACAN